MEARTSNNKPGHTIIGISICPLLFAAVSFISGCTSSVTVRERTHLFDDWRPVGRISLLNLFERDVKLQYREMSTAYLLPYGAKLQVPVIVRLFTHDERLKLLGAGDDLAKVLTDALKNELGKLRYRVMDDQLGGITIEGRIRSFWIERQGRGLLLLGFPILRLNGRSEVHIELKESSEGPPVWSNVYNVQNTSDEMYVASDSDLQERVDAMLREIVQKIITDRELHINLTKIHAKKLQEQGGYEG